MTLEISGEEATMRFVASVGGQYVKLNGIVGIPDRMALLPGAKICFIEHKRPKKGVHSKLQKWWIDKLTDLGFSCMFTDSSESAINFIKAVMNETS